MPKGQFPKVKGAICNVPIDNVDVSNLLPRQAGSNGLMIIKLKRKLEYKGHVYFEPIRSRIAIGLLEYLKLHSHLYKDVTIVPDNIPQCIDTSDHSNSSKEQYNETLETDENPLDNYRIATNETSMVSNIIEPAFEKSQEGVISIAPGEKSKPVPIFKDVYCEELAQPNLFPTGRFGYKSRRDVPLSPGKYFNQRLLNYTQKFASDSEYIFFANHIFQQMHLNDQINIAMQKVKSSG